MKLLPKSEIDRQKAVEQKTAIDEGLKIARKIDNLREVRADEETSLEKWRRETVALIHEEISHEATKRDDLKREVSVLADEKRELQKPLDSAWDSYHQADAGLIARGEAVAEAERALERKQKEASEVSKETAEALKAAKVREELADTRLRDADTTATQAEATLKDAARIKDEAQVVKRNAENEFTHREKLVIERESGATMRETDLAEREKKLADGWRLLADREALFERNLKRK